MCSQFSPGGVGGWRRRGRAYVAGLCVWAAAAAAARLPQAGQPHGRVQQAQDSHPRQRTGTGLECLHVYVGEVCVQIPSLRG